MIGFKHLATLPLPPARVMRQSSAAQSEIMKSVKDGPILNAGLVEGDRNAVPSQRFGRKTYRRNPYGLPFVWWKADDEVLLQIFLISKMWSSWPFSVKRIQQNE